MATATDRDRFQRLWQGLARRLQLDRSTETAVGRGLVEAYSGDDRHYHDVRHILAMLDSIEGLADRFKNLDAARLAAFFHDVVYIPGRTDNERESAERLLASFPSEIDDDLIASAGGMIMATREHRPTGEPSVDLFIDVDMSILAAPWPEYARYAEGVMREFVPVFGEQAYRDGRVALFLAPILEKGIVFLTEAYAPRNADAMCNLARERVVLASGGGFDVREFG